MIGYLIDLIDVYGFWAAFAIGDLASNMEVVNECFEHNNPRIKKWAGRIFKDLK